MDKTNSKILTCSFAAAAAILGFTISMLIKSFAGAFGVIARLVDSDLVRHGFPVGIAILFFVVLQFNRRVLAWGDEVVSEVRKVVWPSQKDMTAMTLVVIVMVLISSGIVTGFDAISGYLISHLTQ